MRSHHRGNFSPTGGADSDSKGRQQQRSPSPPPFSRLFGNSTAKRISVLFVVLNIFALLRYWNLMNRTQLAMTKDNHLEQMIGSYHFHGKSNRTKNFLQKNSQNEHLSTQKDEESTDSGMDSVALDGLMNTTKILDDLPRQRQRRNDGHDSSEKTLASDSVSNKKANTGKFAYAFLIGGAMSDKKGTDYRGGLFGVVVAAHSLRRQGSKADVVLMVQMSATTNATSLPEIEEKLLEAMNIKVIYLPKVSHLKLECFYSLMMEKFRILKLEEYSRVLYLDADVLPTCNLDYMMELSEEGKLLQENVVLSYSGEPASGGFFVLKPNATDYFELVSIIKRTEKKYLELEYPHWDPVEGWGHVIDESDAWKTKKGDNGTNWTFYGAQADQGLLYYWTKYYKKSVSIIINRNSEQWGTKSRGDDLRLLSFERDLLKDHVCTNSERSGWGDKKIQSPSNNYVHFTGRGKPWYRNREDLEKAANPKHNETANIAMLSNHEYWFWLLKDALQKTGLEEKISLDFITAESNQPSLGKTPSFDARAQHIRRKAENDWRQYEHEEFDRSSPRTVPSHITDTRKWAYAFLLGGARSETEDTEYIAGLYSVVVAAHEFRKLGSRADFVLMVQIAAESSHEKLSNFEEELLRKMNIKVVYIPKFASSELECFYSLMMEKFRILKLTEYSRVMYLDYDVIPTCNLDYLFDLSDPLPELLDEYSFRLKENVILAYQREPSSGGIFIVKPNSTDYENIQRIIHEKESRLLQLPYPHWDPSTGWGHVITPPDYWKDVRGRVGTNWTWYGVEADQGLLYYWTKYVKKSVSIIAREDVEQWDSDNWETSKNGSLVLRPREDEEGDVTTIVKKAFKSIGCPKTHFLPSPYNDFFHLTGRAKPWYQTQEHLENPDCTKDVRECKIRVVWYNSLKEALKSVDLLDGFSWEFLGTGKIAPLGHSPGKDQIAEYMKAKKERNWNQYRQDIE